MAWFEWIGGPISSFQLDIVGFLAILGEGSVLANSQVAALSNVTFLPRLLPAPQALLRPSRPDKLVPHPAIATSVVSGNIRHSINLTGHILADIEDSPAYSVRCVEIVRKPHFLAVTAKLWGPLYVVTILGFIFSLTLLALSIWQKDGMALMANIFLSVLSTITGYGGKSKVNVVKPLKYEGGTRYYPGDVVIRYQKGNFLVVKCSEDTARQLFFVPENINYLIQDRRYYRIISLVGTVLLMFGVIFLGNSKVYMQLAFAGAYIIMNALYWIIAALPEKVHWDLSCFEVRDQCFEFEDGSIPKPKGNKYINYNETFAQALWKVIVATRDINWARRSNAAPETDGWNNWLLEAKAKAETARYYIVRVDAKEVVVRQLPDWNPDEELTSYLVEDQNRNKV